MPRIEHTRLGPREVAVMDRLWDETRAVDVREVHERIGAPSGLSRNTIHSTLERLVQKGLASRQRRGRAYEYRATGTRQAWIAEVFDSVVGRLGEADRGEVLAGFVDFADRSSDSTLKALEAIVTERIRERSEREEP